MSPKSTKAQVSVEFMNMVGVIILISAALLAITAYQNRAAYDTSVKIAMQRTCNDFATAINQAHTGGSGFTTHLTLPSTIKGRSYGILINNKTAVLSADSNVVFCRILSSSVSYTTIGTGAINLTNTNGTVYIS